MAKSDTGDLMPPALFQGIAKDSISFRMLASMGWKEGEGLGAKKQGITEHIKVKKKHDSQGVGAAEQSSRLRDWTTGMVNYDRILSGLKEVTAKHDSSSSDSEEERQEAPKKVQKVKKLGKKGKAERSSAEKKTKTKKRRNAVLSSNYDSSNSSSSSSEDEDEPINQSVKTKQATHIGRYHKRESAKRVKGYSASDLAAILGATSDGLAAASEATAAEDNEWPQLREVRATPNLPEDSDVSSSGHVSEGSDGEAAPKKAASNRSIPDQSAGPKSWWAGLFVKAGRMGSTKHELRSRKLQSVSLKPPGFSEKDQEDLAMQAHLGATKGKQGLGRAGAPKKVAGARWSGKKTKIGSDSEEEDEESAAVAAAVGVLAGDDDASSSSDDEPEGAVVVWASKKEQANGHVRKEVIAQVPSSKRLSVQSDTAGSFACKSSEKVKIQWKKEAKRHLKGAPKQRLEIHILRERVLLGAGLEDDKGKMLKKLSQLPSVFKVCEKFVRLL